MVLKRYMYGDPFMSEAKKVSQQGKQAGLEQMSTLPARIIMSQKPVTLVKGTRIHLAIKTLGMNNLSGAPVVDQNDKVIGIVTEYDLLMQAATKDVVDPISYTDNVTTVGPETTLKELLLLFHKTKYRFIPVVDSGCHLMGIVNRIDILNKLMGFA